MTGAIERAGLTRLQIPFKEPIRTPGGLVPLREAILVTLETADSLGVGECAPWCGEPFHRLDACWAELSGVILPSLLGRTFGEAEELAALATEWSADPSARAGAETACWDLIARGRHESLAETLGASPDRILQGVASGLSVGLAPTIIQLLQTIERHLEEGYQRVKIGIAPGQDLEPVRAIRQHFGDIPLWVDAGGAYSRADIDLFRRLDEYELLMYEQPFPPDDLDGLAELQAAVATPVCLDETAASPDRTAEAIRRGAGRIVSLKLQRVGGFGPALAIEEHCRREGVACWVGSLPELGVGQVQALHLATLANCKYPTDVQPSARWYVDDYISPLLELSDNGVFLLPDRAGLGYQVDRAKVVRYQVRHEEFTTRTVG